MIMLGLQTNQQTDIHTYKRTDTHLLQPIGAAQRHGGVIPTLITNASEKFNKLMASSTINNNKM